MSQNMFKRAVALLQGNENSESENSGFTGGAATPTLQQPSLKAGKKSNMVDTMGSWRVPGLLAIMQQGDTVFANFERSALKTKPKLLRDGKSVSFDEVLWKSLKQGFFNTDDISKKASSTPPESVPGENFACWINEYADWALVNRDTIQILISNRQRPCLVSFDTTKTIVQGDDPLYFHALLGVHRAEATLHVHIRNCDTGQTVSKSISFDHNFEGGQHSDAYQKVAIGLPSAKAKYDVRFEVAYEKCTDIHARVDPFLFIADPHVAPYQFAERPFILAGSEENPSGTWLSAKLAAEEKPKQFPKIEMGSETTSFVPSDFWPIYDFFDEEYYVTHNTDVDFTAIEPFEHYCMIGWREKRNPNPEFNVQEYLLRHADVEAQDIDPLLHYALHGKIENRSLGVFNEVLQGIWTNSKREMPSGSQEAILARAQDFMLPMDIINTRKLIVMMVPEHNAMSGGIYSIFSIADHMRRTRHIHGYDVIVMTRPNAKNMTYLRNSAFRNSETVFRFDQLRLFRSVTDLQLHIPEYATVEFMRSLPLDMMSYLMRRDKVHVNILNQNTRLMPESDKFRDLRRMATTIGQSVAHHAYAGQEFADRYDLPTLLLPAYTDLTPYPPSTYDNKENLIIYSDDTATYRPDVMNKLESLGDYKLVKIKDITFDRYMELATRCRFSVSFGEGFDGYVAQPMYQGGIGFALYTDEFFPNKKFKKFENFFETEKDMIDQIVPTIRRLEKDKKRFVALNTALRKEWDALYSVEDYIDRIGKVVRQEYEVFPNTSKNDTSRT